MPRRSGSRQAGVPKPSATKAPPKPIPMDTAAAGSIAGGWSNGWGFLRPRLLPWWVVLLVGGFALAKTQILLESPCGILGTSSPVTRSSISKALRALSMCTHPDKLEPGDRARGQVLFERASRAKDALLAEVLGSKTKQVACKSNQIEEFVYELSLGVAHMLGDTGLQELQQVGALLWEFVWTLITFERGIVDTVLTALFAMTILSFLRGFVSHLLTSGPIVMMKSLMGSVLVAAPSTLVLWLISPTMRAIVFVRDELRGLRSESTDQRSTDQQVYDAPSAENATMELTQPLEDVSQPGLSTGVWYNLERRVRPATPALFAKVRPSVQALLIQAQTNACRATAALDLQFDLLLTLTKPVIPLIMLLATGSVFKSGMSHLIIGYGLRSLVPSLSQEALHLIAFLSGIFHSLLGASTGQIEAMSDGIPRGLMLAWKVSFHDVFAVLNMAMLGGMFSGRESLGNEPSFSASLSAGIALRIILSEAVDQTQYENSFGNLLYNTFNVVLANSREVTARAISGVGDCAGGPFQMLLGADNTLTMTVMATLMKLLLMVIPVLAGVQWAVRARNEMKFGTLTSKFRFGCSILLSMANLTQCLLLAVFKLDAANGSLGNLWILVLLGCTLESLLSVYQLRGMVRQFVFFLMFIGMP
eukprot:TRINITY_DN3060_c0_g1_i8.p1 TRINITY_DN3060_c0_g1~~TRINITY_DN3060_c0_g1_i8.p1  ORF type:complete len:647 (+),score=148.16 TRINITY_DN3060_c0_g1_i8:57-1997(+)